jgi:hypothetical protein
MAPVNGSHVLVSRPGEAIMRITKRTPRPVVTTEEP